MVRPISLAWLLSLVLALIPYSSVKAELVLPDDMACPVMKDADASSKLGKVGEMPGSVNLRKGIVWLDQGRYAAAYTAFEDAIAQGLPDVIERAHAYRQIGLLMCRLDSPQVCQRGLQLAFMTNGPFELPMATLRLPHVQGAYRQARAFFESRCVTGAPPIQAKAKAVETVAASPSISAKPSDQVSLTMMTPKDIKKNKYRAPEATTTVLLRVKPWATVAIDDSEVVTPPVKALQIKPGVRMITIKHPSFEPVLIEADFKKGQTWVVRQAY